MGQFDFTGDLHAATTEGNATLAQLARYDDITTLIAGADRLQIVRTPRRKGNFSLRHECRNGDVSSGSTSRNEVFVNNAGRNLYGSGDEFYWGESFYVPSSTTDLASWLLVSQLHGAESGPPQWAVEFTGESIILTIRGGVIAAGGDTNWPRVNSYVIHGEVPRDEWFDLIVYSKLSTTAAGENKAWFKLASDDWPASPQVDVTGVNVITIGASPLTLPPPRLSVYRDERAETTVIYRTGCRLRKSLPAIKQMFVDDADLTAVIQADNPVGHWIAGADPLNDLGSGNNDLTAVNSPTLNAASLRRDGEGVSVDFNPANSYLVGPDLSLGEGNAWTLEAICDVNTGSGGNRVIVGEGRSNDADPLNQLLTHFNQALYRHTTDAGVGTTLTVSTTGARQVSTTSGTNHVVVRCDKTAQLAEIWVDGELQGSVAFNPGATSFNNLLIGAQNANGTISRYLSDAKVQHPVAFGGWLSDDRIQARWNALIRESVEDVPLGPIGIPVLIPNICKLDGVVVALA